MLDKAIFSFLICFSITSGLKWPIFSNGEDKIESPFRLILSKENVSLHERDIVNEEGTGARELKAVFAVESSLQSLVRMLKDQGKGVIWNPAACNYTVIPGDEESWTTHVEYDLPWPFSNHDAVVKHVIKRETNSTEVHFESIDGVIPETKGVERMRLVKGKWTIRQIDPSLVEVSYQLSSKRGPLPRIITDPIVHYQMVKSMSTLRRLLEESEI